MDGWTIAQLVITLFCASGVPLMLLIFNWLKSEIKRLARKFKRFDQRLLNFDQRLSNLEGRVETLHSMLQTLLTCHGCGCERDNTNKRE